MAPHAHTRLTKAKPSLPRRWLLLIAGGVWCTVGAMLVLRGAAWLLGMTRSDGTLWGLLGMGLAAPVYRLGILQVARKNLMRISRLPERPCLFAFTAWRGYLIIGIMVTAGIVLRSSPLPREVLAPVYIGMGGALLAGSRLFFKMFLETRTKESGDPL